MIPKGMVAVQCAKCVLVLPERELFNHMPQDVLMSAMKRGKGFKRTQDSYHRKGNGKHQTFNDSNMDKGVL